MVNNTAKNVAEQPGSGKDSATTRQQQLGKQVIDELVKHQFRPVHIIINTSPLLRQFMGPYISLLRHHTRVTAYFWWEIAGHQQELEQDFWLGAERYVNALGVWARSVGWPQTAVGQEFERRIDMFMHAMPVQYYLEKVRQLAKQMWEDAGSPLGETREFWVAAENHVLTIACLTVAMANTIADATENLTKVFGAFAAEVHLKAIREVAYHIWEASGGTSGHALEDWLKAERQILSHKPQSPPIVSVV